MSNYSSVRHFVYFGKVLCRSISLVMPLVTNKLLAHEGLEFWRRIVPHS
jgi:hypothetical protein